MNVQVKWKRLIPVLFGIVICGSGAMLAKGLWDDHQRQRAYSQASAEHASSERNRQLAVSQFESHKLAILSEVQDKLDAGQARAALELASKYPVNDPDLVNMIRSAGIAVQNEQLRREAALPLAERARLFADLHFREPANALYAARAREFASSEVAAQQDAAPGHGVPRDHPCYSDGYTAAQRVLINRSSAYAVDPLGRVPSVLPEELLPAMSSVAPLKLPQQVTWKWVREHVPVNWFWYPVAALGAVFAAGIGAGKYWDTVDKALHPEHPAAATSSTASPAPAALPQGKRASK